MRLQVVPFKVEHLDALVEQEATAYLRPFIQRDMLRTLEGGDAYTAFWDGRAAGSCGVVKHWEGRGEAWAFLAQDCREAFPFIHKAVARFLGCCPYRRIEAAVDCDFSNGHRWVKMLGFQQETPEPMKGYGPDGRDYYLYARVN